MLWNREVAKQLFGYFIQFVILLTLFLLGLFILIDQINDFLNGHIIWWKFLLIILGYGFLSGSISGALMCLIWIKDLWQTNRVEKRLVSHGIKIYEINRTMENLDSKLVEIIQKDLAECDELIKAYNSLPSRKFSNEYFWIKQYETIEAVVNLVNILMDRILKAVKFFQTFETYEIQKLPFPEPMIDYLFKGANQKTWLKLCQTSKYFYGQHRVIVYDGVVWKFDDPKVDIDIILRNWKRFRSNVWLKNIFKVHGIDKDKVPHPSIATQFLQRIIYCDIIELFLICQTITLDDYLKLTSFKKIKRCFLAKVNIIDSINGSFIQLDDILKYLPNIETFTCVANSFTSKESKPISQLPQLLNLKKFDYWDFNEGLTSECFCQFIEGNLNCYSYLVKFKKEVNPEFIFKFRQDVSKLLKVLEDSGRKITIEWDDKDT